MNNSKQIREILLYAALCCFFPTPALAQISADGTTATDVNSPDGQNFDIDGGDKAGGNLFHSFRDFSVPDGGSASFLNSPDIVNIINRVTGGNISEINGLLKAGGSANLFLINPAGIVFGPNASLNIGGSFLSSTADSLLFSDGTEFSATNLTKPLLTINAPIGLNLRDNPSPISNNSIGGLQVQPGNNVTLVGGNLNFDGGKIIAPGGTVSLGSFTSQSTVGLNADGSLSFPSGVQRGDLNLANGSSVDVRADGGGFIGINVRNLNMSGSSLLEAGIAPNLGSPEAKAGNININATGSISLREFSKISNNTSGIGDAGLIKIDADETIAIDGRIPVLDDTTVKVRPKDIYSGISATVRPEGKGNAGGVEINTKNLSITNGGQIVADTFGEGNAGTIKINANDTIAVSGDGNGSFIGITSVVEPEEKQKDSNGHEIEITRNRDAGKIEISTKNLFLTNVAQVTTSNFGTGNAGTLRINAKENISVDGNNNKEAIYSGITSIISGGKIGKAGDLEITTKNLSLTNGGQIGPGSFAEGDGGIVKINATEKISVDGRVTDLLQDGKPRSVPTSISSGVGGKGNGGNIEINTKNLSITNGGQIGAVNIGEGNAGTVKINATEKISVDGRKDGVSSLITSEIEPTGKGNAGGIEITTKNLSLTNGGKISSSNLGVGETGGNINLNFTGVLSLRGGSSISAQAKNNTSGGNINIIAPEGFIVALPNQNNDIIAIADRGKGGKIEINVNRVYGFAQNRIQQILPANDPSSILNNGENDLNSSSGNPQLSGILNINTQQLDPAKDRTKTPENVVETDETVAQSCSVAAQLAEGINSFIITGRGGLQQNGTQPRTHDTIRISQEQSGRRDKKTRRSGEVISLDENKKTFSSDEVIPARGMAVNEKGQIVLTAYPTPNAGDRSPVSSVACQ
jgi:filamentous hemagglutinin family protein